MSKVIVIIIATVLMGFTSVSSARDISIAETVTKPVGRYEFMFFPACNVSHYYDICDLISIRTKNKRIVDLVGPKGVNAFIARNGLNPRITDGNTILPVGGIFAMGKFARSQG